MIGALRRSPLVLPLALVAAPARRRTRTRRGPSTARPRRRSARCAPSCAELERKVALMEWSAARYADWSACLRGVPVSEYGDPDRQFGYAYDERRRHGPRLHARARRRPEAAAPAGGLHVPRLPRGGDCRSDAPRPGGTAEAAPRRAAPPAARCASLERRVRRLKRAARRLEAAAERFDAWESCVSWVPVTEYGDPDGGFGYLFGAPARRRSPTGPRSPSTAATGTTRTTCSSPSSAATARAARCQNEPGEAVD